MTLKEYRLRKGILQAQLVEEIKDFCPEIDVPLLSKIERGIVDPPKVLQEYIDKALANGFDEGNEEVKANMSTDLLKLLNEPNHMVVYEMISEATIDRPVTKKSLMLRTNLCERQVRRAIAEMRSLGVRIGTCSSRKGYWMCHSEGEYELIRNDLRARAMTLLKTIKVMDNSCEGQVEL